MPHAAIRDLPFRHNLKPGLGFEIFRLADLFRARARTTSSRRRSAPSSTPSTSASPARAAWSSTSRRAARRGHADGGRARPRPAVHAARRRSTPGCCCSRPSSSPGHALARRSRLGTRPRSRSSRDDRRDLVALAEQLAAEQARPLDAVQPALLAALLRAVLLRAERLVAHDRAPAPPAELERFFTILERDCRRRARSRTTRSRPASRRAGSPSCSSRTPASRTKQVIDDRVVLEQKRLLAHTDSRSRSSRRAPGSTSRRTS